MELYETYMLVLQMIASGEVTTMALFTAYIDDELGYEIFCENLPPELFCMLQDNIKGSLALCEALMDAGLLQKGVEIYIDRAFDDCNMLYHLMDGECTILTDPILSGFLSNDDRSMLDDLFKRWNDGSICEENWEDIFTEMCRARASK